MCSIVWRELLESGAYRCAIKLVMVVDDRDLVRRGCVFYEDVETRGNVNSLSLSYGLEISRRSRSTDKLDP